MSEETPGPLPRPGLKLTGVFVSVVVVGLLVGWVFRADDGAVAEIGQPAPDFTVTLIDGGTFTLSEHLETDDRPIVLNLWASWCIPCRTETPDISAFAEANPDVKVIGVSVEDTEKASRAFADEYAPSYDVGLGNAEFEAAYPRLGLPVTYIIGANGVVVELFNGIVTQEILEDITTHH
ncbi:MAG: TlpA family protein disulfide reductase [Acidobacteria bacterium]|nr:MAG: TlpA family protein disulfide reductase [Acidobacteriota bacterium]